MKLTVLLIALLLVGLLIYKQMGSGSSHQAAEIQAISSGQAPEIPTKPQDVKKFGAQMDAYMVDENQKRAAALEEATSK